MESILSAISNSRRPQQRGIAVFVFALCLIAIVPVMGLAIDVAVLYMAQSKLSAGADAAVLAAARGLSRGSDSSAQQANAVTVATNYINAAFPTGFLGSSGLTSATTITLQANQRTVTTTASVTVPLMFMRWVGPSTSIVRALATATRRDVNVMLVIDRSGSLQNSGSCTPMKAAAAAFVGQFALGRDNLGLVTFNSASRVDFAPSQSFSSVATTINALTCIGGTNSGQGLFQGYQQLVSLNQPTALNVILFFTDGNPTHTTISSYIKSTSSCASKNTWRTGVIGANAVNPSGFYDPLAPIQPTSATPGPVSGSSGCAYSSNSNSVASDISTVDVLDVFGNSISAGSATGYGSISYSGSNIVIDRTNMLSVAENTTFNAAKRIRQGATTNGSSLAGVYIYSIGLGTATEPPDAAILRDVANDLTARNFDSNIRAGLYVEAPSAADLNPAFQRVASEVLRLAQ